MEDPFITIEGIGSSHISIKKSNPDVIRAVIPMLEGCVPTRFKHGISFDFAKYKKDTKAYLTFVRGVLSAEMETYIFPKNFTEMSAELALRLGGVSYYDAYVESDAYRDRCYATFKQNGSYINFPECSPGIIDKYFEHFLTWFTNYLDSHVINFSKSTRQGEFIGYLSTRPVLIDYISRYYGSDRLLEEFEIDIAKHIDDFHSSRNSSCIFAHTQALENMIMRSFSENKYNYFHNCSFCQKKTLEYLAVFAKNNNFTDFTSFTRLLLNMKYFCVSSKHLSALYRMMGFAISDINDDMLNKLVDHLSDYRQRVRCDSELKSFRNAIANYGLPPHDELMYHQKCIDRINALKSEYIGDILDAI